MKKTITLLLAAASMAMGATPMNITWDNNTSTNTFGDDFTAVTAVFTLDILAINSNGPIFSFTPNGGVTLYGMMAETDEYGCCLFDSTLGRGEKSIFNFAPYPEETSAVIAYTYDKATGHASIKITTYDIFGGTWTGTYGKDADPLDFTSIATLTKSSAVGKIDVYNTALQGDEIAAAIEFLKNPTVQPDGPETPVEPSEPAVPEPTTATLSLLALAGLAARRRRR